MRAGFHSPDQVPSSPIIRISICVLAARVCVCVGLCDCVNTESRTTPQDKAKEEWNKKII